MAFCLRQVFAPRVESVTFEQEAVRGFVLFEREGDRVCEGLHVLRVFDYRQPFAVFVRANVLQPFQHLVSLNVNTTFGAEEIGKHRVPD